MTIQLRRRMPSVVKRVARRALLSVYDPLTPMPPLSWMPDQFERLVDRYARAAPSEKRTLSTAVIQKLQLEPATGHLLQHELSRARFSGSDLYDQALVTISWATGQLEEAE